MSTMSDFDAGRLVAQVETLTKAVEALAKQVQSLEHQASFGRGVFWGILLVAGGLGGLAVWAFQKITGIH